MRLILLSLVVAGAVSTPTPRVLPALNLLADGVDTHSAGGAFQLDTLSPTLTWTPMHDGFTTLGDFLFTVSIRCLSDSSSDFSELVASVQFPRYQVRAGILKEGTSYEWVVESLHTKTGVSVRSQPAAFHVGLVDPASWANVSWIGSTQTNLYRTEFEVETQDIEAADLYVCGLGFSNVLINGKNISDAVLVTSPWANNARGNFFSWYNVTQEVKASPGGKNALGVALGHGWRDTASFPRHDKDWSGDAIDRVLRAQLRVTFSNGTVETVVVTSNEWTTTAGPIISDSVYNGETFNASMEQSGWSQPNFDPVSLGFDAWAPATVIPGPIGAMVPWSAPPVMISHTYAPVNITSHSGPAADPTCAVAAEKKGISLACGGTNNIITQISFAAYGTPTGSCANHDLQHNPKCDANITNWVATQCVGKASCSIECDDASCGGKPLPGGDPCYLTAKSVAVAVQCKTPPPAPAHATSYVVDFGVNVAGVARLSNIHEAAGTEVVMKYAEILQHKGLPGLPNPDPTAIYQANLRSAKATDTYICKGDPAGESYTPTMTYHGFRYVEITGLTSEPSVELLHFHSNVAPRSTANFSSPTLNRILRMGIGSQQSNMMTVPTDCDQRDERLGWMGDADLSSDSMCVNFDCPAFFKYFLRAMSDEMDSDGSLPDTVPWVRYGNRPGDVSWTAAFPQYVYTLYKSAGDVDTIKTYFSQVLAQLSNVEAQAKAGVCHMHTPYGDWCPPPSSPGKGQGPKPSNPYTTVFSYANMAANAAEMARAIGDTANATALEALSAKLLDSFNTCFDPKATGVYDNGVMTTDVLALQLGATNVANTTAATRKHLLDSVAANGNHFTTGIIGWKFLLQQLAQAGHKDVAQAILEQTTYPSIGYEATNTLEPATTNLWELTDAPFEGTGMNSRNHHMFSSFSKYMQQELAGLRHQFQVHEHNDGVVESVVDFLPASSLGLSKASTTLELRHGTASIDWQRHGGTQCSQAASSDTAVLDCGHLGGVIASIHFALLGPVPNGTCGAFMADCGVDIRALATTQCVGKQRCSFSPEVETNRLGVSNAELCVREHYGEAAAVALQGTCTIPSIIDVDIQAPLGLDERRLVFPGKSLIGASAMEVKAVDSAGVETLVFPVKSTQQLGSVGVTAVDVQDDAVVLKLLAGSHHIRATL